MEHNLELMILQYLTSKLKEESQYDEDDYNDMLGKEKPKPVASVEVLNVGKPDAEVEESEESDEPSLYDEEQSDPQEKLSDRIAKMRNKG